MYVLSGLFVIALLWGYLTEVDVVVRAPGIVRPDGEVVRITSDVAGLVEVVHVQEGESVHTGDVLIQLDYSDIRLERDTVQQQIALLQEQIENVVRRIQDASSIHVLEVTKLEVEIVAARQDLLLERNQYWAQLESSVLRLEQAREEYATHQRLAEEGLIARRTLERVETELGLAQAQHREIETRHPSAASLNSLLETRNMIGLRFESRQRDLRAEETPIEARLADWRSRLDRMAHQSELRSIRSPVTGQVTLLPTLHSGEYIGAGTLIAAIAPVPVRPIVEALVPNANAVDVRVGQPARLRIDESATLDGIVFSVGPDARFTESSGGAFRVLIATDTLDLRLGLAMEVRLITREERVLNLLFNRIERAFR